MKVGDKVIRLQSVGNPHVQTGKIYTVSKIIDYMSIELEGIDGLGNWTFNKINFKVIKNKIYELW